jgi:signal transduction histidine kinase
MSHELRTPLNAIGGYAELMEMGIRGPVTEPQREDLSRIQRSQRHLLGLVNEVLNYAKLESGSVRYAAADVAVHEAVADAAALVAPQARAKGLALSVRECRADLAARADPEKLRQVVVNLLSNAIKFTDHGGAELFVTCDDDAGTVAIRVRDTGIGIPADKLGVIFDPFVQVRADLTRTADGAGLGPGDQPRPGARHGRRPHGREHAGRGEHLHLDAAGRAGRRVAPSRPRRRRSGARPVGAHPRGHPAVLLVTYLVCRPGSSQ